MWIKQIAVFIMTLSDDSQTFIVLNAMSYEIKLYLLQLVSRDDDLAVLFELLHKCRDCSSIFTV
ncbi:hypothetical protein D3C80_2237640 [compost metagenome]